MPQDQPISLQRELKRRFVTPYKNLGFKIYFFFIVILLAGMGVYLPNIIRLWQGNKIDWSSTPTDLATYELAILATAAVDMLFSKKIAHQDLRLILCISLVFVSVLSTLVMTNPAFFLSIWLAALLTIYALCVWWILSADDEMFTEGSEEITQAALGDVQHNPTGTLKGFKH